MKPVRIAIICQNDTLWSLYAWNMALPLLLNDKEFEVVGFWRCNEKFMNVHSGKVLNWYLKAFGPLNFLLLALFKIIFQIVTSIKAIISNYKTSFYKLCSFYNVPFFIIESPNEKKLSDWIKKNKVEIVVIMVGHILKGEILTAPSNCTINKHAALLPANKGVFPYFWAKLKQEPQGISFHKVVSKIDEGDLVYQEVVNDKKTLSSMIAFYFYSYKNYGKMLLEALKNAKNHRTIKPGELTKPSYHGGPKAEDYKKFRKGGGSIIRPEDLLLPLSL